jgi:hypothetical protein
MKVDEVKERAEKAGLTQEILPSRKGRRVRRFERPGHWTLTFVGRRDAMVFLLGYEAGKRCRT